ncbi:hypothetical protein FDECE_11157, partial [Fusarium decemcellulare]
SPLVTDAYFHYTPSQIMMAALSIVDSELIDALIPGPVQNGDAAQESAFASMRDKIMGTIESCRKMLEEEPPERMTSYWGLPETIKAMKPLRKKLQKCRDPDRANLVNLQRARREQAMNKEKKVEANQDGSVFGDELTRETKRVKLENADPFGPPL